MLSFTTTTLLVLVVVLVLLPANAYAFGPGEIPDYSFLHNKAYRHGDIENALAVLAKAVATAAAGGSLALLPTGVAEFAQKIAKYSHGPLVVSNDYVKKVYFGNWLRDYSQFLDISSLSKFSADTLVLVVSILGFKTFNFATDAFEVTSDRLGVYLPVEHIDNPKGYGSKEPGGNPRQVDPRLRPTVNPIELEFDDRTGMKNYMATEDGTWDSSTAFIRRTFKASIAAGRQAGGNDVPSLWDAYRDLGAGLHTLEDLLAHSNWCEISLRKMGHSDVFCFVGDKVTVNTPTGPAPPLVTGTFGSADLLFSLTGGVSDDLSQISAVNLNDDLNKAKNDGGILSTLESILDKIPFGSSIAHLSQGKKLQQDSESFKFDPAHAVTVAIRKEIFQILQWRDDTFRTIASALTKFDLGDHVGSFSDALDSFVFKILAPYLTPLLDKLITDLTNSSKDILDSDKADQFAVFDQPTASDPTHSLLAKDHFEVILNEPAGQIASLVTEYAASLVIEAWFDTSLDPDAVVTRVLEAFHHPYYSTANSPIQQEMFSALQTWVKSLGSNSDHTISLLSKESVRAGKNVRST